MDLKGKKVIITGGAVRIGAALVKKFSSYGAHVIIHYNNSQVEAEQLLESIGGEDAGHSIIKADLSDLPSIPSFFHSLGRVDILINSASLYEPRSFIE